MSEHSYRIIMTTSNNYLPVVRISAWLINRYWQPNPQVLVAGFKPPEYELPSNFTFTSLGDQRDYPFGKFSNAFIKLLHQIDDEVFIYLLDDYFIPRPVDTRNICILVDYMHQFKFVCKMDLALDRLYAYGCDLEYGNVGSIDLIKSMSGSQYHCSLWGGIWNKTNMLRMLIPDESPHQIELIGTTRLSHMQDLIVLGTRQCPMKMYAGLRALADKKIDLSGLNPQDVSEL